ncbi:MAG: uL22 family ribosomal protein [Candidatus Pacearchaeota archaeon]
MADEQLIQTQIKKEKPVAHQINKLDNEKEVNKDKTKKDEQKPKKGDEKEKKLTKAPKKTEVSVYGRSLPISLKHSVALGKFIKGKKIDEAIKSLEEVSKNKKAILIKGEMAHKKGRGMMTGKYPIKASKNFIRILKSLSANAINHGMELEITKILKVISNKAPEQRHRFGRTKFKRTHVKIIAKEVKK